MTAVRRRSLVVAGRFRELEDALCERLREVKEADPLAPVTVIVGSASLRLQLSDHLVSRLGAVANVSLVTLARHAAGLAAGEGVSPRLGAAATERLLRLVTDSVPLDYFAPVARRPHFAAALAATFADLREGLVDPGSGWHQHLDADGAVSPRATDLAGLYGAYCTALRAHGVSDQAAVHVAAARVLDREGDGGAPAAGAQPPIGASHTILYGLYDLNRAQAGFVAALLRTGADLFVPLPAGVPADSAVLALRQDRERPPRSLPPTRPGSDRERLALVWHQTPASMGRLELTGDGSLEVVSVPDERIEAREAARAVLQAAAAGTPSWDCAVVVPAAADKERVAGALDAAGLPFACVVPARSAGRRVLLRLLDCLAPSAGPPFSRRAVVDLLCAAPLGRVPSTDEDRSLWLDEARRAGILAGLEQWADRMGSRRHGLERSLARLEREAETGIPPGDEGWGSVPSRKRRLAAASSLQEAVGALADACATLPQHAGWSEWSAALGAVVASLFQQPAAAEAADAVAGLRSLDVLGESVDLAVVAAVLREQLAAAVVSRGRAGRDGVTVCTPLELRGLTFSTVVFTGLAEGGFPVVGRADPLLGDRGRRRVAEALGTRLPLADERAGESLLLFAFASEAARERLVLLAARSDAATGRPRLPSRFLLKAASLAAGHPVGLEEYLGGGPLRPVWRHVSGPQGFREDPEPAWLNVGERDCSLLLELGAVHDAGTTAAYLGHVLGGASPAQRRLGAWRASGSPEPGSWDGLLGERARARLAAHHPLDGEIHATRLERYVNCPFIFFLRDVLRLDPPDEPSDGFEIEAIEYGTLAHAILQRGYQSLIASWPDLAQDARLQAAREAIARAWEVCCAEAERSGVTGAPLAWEVRRTALLEDLLEAVSRDPVFKEGGGHPVQVEWSFGERAERPVVVTLPDGAQACFGGRVDRVDQTPRGVRVVDYKTGAGSSEQKRLDAGLGAQLPVYRLAAVTWLAGESADAEALYRMVTRRGQFRDIQQFEDQATTIQRLADLVAAARRLIDAGLFPRCSKSGCDFCDVGYACGSTGWARARKREHPLVRAVAELQDMGPSPAVTDA